MHGNTRDLTGQRFGRLVVTAQAHGRSRVSWLCECDCGATKTILACNITCGKTTSCGKCVNVAANMRVHRVWSSMLSRCRNRNHRAFHLYGGRGISVCDRWSSFSAFLTDMGQPPEGHSLDRVNNDGNYEPANCRWATKNEQANNTRANRLITIDGRTQTMKQWASERGLNYATVKTRLNVLGWAPERALHL
jgi:hypothetical protein